jgi:hypothetical protein
VASEEKDCEPFFSFPDVNVEQDTAVNEKKGHGILPYLRDRWQDDHVRQLFSITRQ